MIQRVIKKADSSLKSRCERLSYSGRKWVVLSMFGLFTASFIYNLIIEIL